MPFLTLPNLPSTSDLNKLVNYFMLPSTFVSLLSSSECVSRGSGGGGTVGELAPSLLTAPWRKELLMLAGDVETNPGPYTNYGKNTCDINLGSITLVAGLRGHMPPLQKILLHCAHHTPHLFLRPCAFVPCSMRTSYCKRRTRRAWE